MADDIEFVTMRAVRNHERTIYVPRDKVEYRSGLGWELVPEDSTEPPEGDSKPSRASSRKSKSTTTVETE